MIRDLLDWFQGRLADEAQASSAHDLELATAALLMEVSRADQDKGADERDAMIDLLGRTFTFSDEELAKLVRIAEETTDESTDLYSFTSVVNQHYGYTQKVHLIRMLWDVAWADGTLEAIEDHIVRRISGLLHVAHHDFVAQRIAARDSRGKD